MIMGLIAAENVVTYVTMAILFVINLLNYIDRYTVVGENKINYIYPVTNCMMRV